MRSEVLLGNPGCGKTVLAASAIEELRANETSSQSQVFYFFFRSGVPKLEECDSLYRALLAQIVQFHHQNEEVANIFRFAMFNSSGQMVASRREMLDLLRLCNKKIGPTIIVLDAIDECVNSETLVRDLQLVLKDSKISLLLFSRPNISYLFENVKPERHIVVGQSNNSDISLFLSRNLEDLAEKGLLPHHSDLSLLLDHLCFRANGMFLWARLMVTYLGCRSLRPQRRVSTILEVTFPEGLEDMYNRIVSLIIQQLQPDQELAKHIITWLANATRELTVQELAISWKYAMSNNLATEDWEENVNEQWVNDIIVACAGLVEQAKLPVENTDRIAPDCLRFIHLTAKEYFLGTHSKQATTDTDAGSHLRFINIFDANCTMGRICLQFLTFQMPSQPLGGSIASAIDLEKLEVCFPFCSYAANCWILHVWKTKDLLENNAVNLDKEPFTSLLRSLSTFIKKPFVIMAWVEACCICHHSPQFVELQGWAQYLAGRLPAPKKDLYTELLNDVQQLGEDLNALESEWGNHLEKSPECIWEEITGFTSSRFLAHTTATKIDSLVNDDIEGAALSSTYLAKISEVSSDGALVGVLSIWPSRYARSLLRCIRVYFCSNTTNILAC